MKTFFVSGLITQTMVHTLQALRDNSFELLATMQVFVQEPSLDWINFTLKQNQDDVDSGMSYFSVQVIIINSFFFSTEEKG